MASPPDYAAIDSLEKAQRLVETGALVRLLMMPEDFGGDARPQNTLYVPPFVAEMKHDFDHGVVIPLAEAGEAVSYRVVPTYHGASLVPVGIMITATTPDIYDKHIAIWRAAER